MSSGIVWLKWWLEDDGSGELEILRRDVSATGEDYSSALHRFKSLSELPTDIAAIVHEDGRREGDFMA